MSMNEWNVIDWIRTQLGTPGESVPVGLGDDCALIKGSTQEFLFKVDSLLETTHFQLHSPEEKAFLSPLQVGYKAMARTISDIAAMGGWPSFALVAVALPKRKYLPASHPFQSDQALQDLFHGLQKAAQPFELKIVGGDTASWKAEQGLCLSVSMLGEIRNNYKPLLRSLAQPGQRLYVTGELGGSILGKHADFIPRVREAEWLGSFGVESMIDLSDGLSSDLWQLCRESGCGARVIQEHLPISEAAYQLAQTSQQHAFEHALHDGEDFELLFGVAAEKSQELERSWPFETGLQAIGECIPYHFEGTKERKPGEGLYLVQSDQEVPLLPAGYQHRL